MTTRASILVLVGALVVTACDDGATRAPTGEPHLEPELASAEPLQPLPPPKQIDPKRASLGRKLFEWPALSSDGKVSCATCHPLDRATTDGLAHSRGAGGKETALNTPTLLNVTYDFRFNWNGAFATIEDELDAPIANTMATSWDAVVAKVRGEPALRDGFSAAYADGVTIANVKDAIARFVDTLVTPDARFDRFLRGDTEALSAEERRGYSLFKELGCVSCHQGANVGGNLFQRLGVMRDYFAARPAPTEGAELGRYNTTKNPADRFVFRVPSLRNVALTAPYFHDGSVPTLEGAISTMARVQLGRAIAADQVGAIAAFLRTLTGEPPRIAP